MRKSDVVSRTSEILRESGARKPVRYPKHTFRITDDEGVGKDFIVRKGDTCVQYTCEDVLCIINAFFDTVCESLSHGESVTLNDFGVFSIKNRKKAYMSVNTGKMEVPTCKYTVKFKPSNRLLMCARMFELSGEDDKANIQNPRKEDEWSEESEQED